MAKIFILEDDPARINAFELALKGHDLTIARWIAGDGGAFWKFNPPYDLFLLDHDLGGLQMVDSSVEETGFQWVKEMGEYKPNLDGPDPTIVVHSYNPEGARAMGKLLLKNGWPRVFIQPFGLALLDWLQKGAFK